MATSPPFRWLRTGTRDGILETSVVPARISETLAASGCEIGHQGGRGDGVRRRAGVELFVVEGHSCWSTRWRRGRTTAATTPWMRAPPISSSSSFGRCADFRWRARGCCRRSPWSICSAICGRGRAPLGGGIETARRPAASVWQSRGPAGPEDGPPELPGGRSGHGTDDRSRNQGRSRTSRVT